MEILIEAQEGKNQPSPDKSDSGDLLNLFA